MSDYSFRDALCLRFGRVQVFVQQVQGEVPAVELKGHECCGYVRICCADVVEEAGEEVGFVGDGEGVCREEVGLDCSACCAGMGLVEGD